MFRLSKWLSRSYRRAIEANIRRTRRSDLSTAAARSEVAEAAFASRDSGGLETFMAVEQGRG